MRVSGVTVSKKRALYPSAPRRFALMKIDGVSPIQTKRTKTSINYALRMNTPTILVVCPPSTSRTGLKLYQSYLKSQIKTLSTRNEIHITLIFMTGVSMIPDNPSSHEQTIEFLATIVANLVCQRNGNEYEGRSSSFQTRLSREVSVV